MCKFEVMLRMNNGQLKGTQRWIKPQLKENGDGLKVKTHDGPLKVGYYMVKVSEAWLKFDRSRLIWCSTCRDSGMAQKVF